jgi:hypothetical protein
MLSPAFRPEVAKNDLRNLINSFTWGWHFFRSGELKAAAPKGSKMLAALLLQKVQQRFRARRHLVIPDFTHRIRQELEFAMQQLDKARDVVCDFELLGLGTKAL